MLDIRFRHRLHLFAKEMECTAAKHGGKDLRKTDKVDWDCQLMYVKMKEVKINKSTVCR